MKIDGKEIKTAYTLTTINDVPALLTDVFNSFGADDHLVDLNVKLGFDQESGEQIVRVLITTFVGELKTPKRC